MSEQTRPIPDGYHTVTPYLTVQGVPELIAFLNRAFGAQVVESTVLSDGSYAHASIQLGDSRLMVSEARPEWPPMPGSIYLYLPDVDAAYGRAIAAGAVSLMEPADQFYGDRGAGVKDPTGNCWWIATHIEDVPAEEVARRAEAVMG